jgi:hypothetical protein
MGLRVRFAETILRLKLCHVQDIRPQDCSEVENVRFCFQRMETEDVWEPFQC